MLLNLLHLCLGMSLAWLAIFLLFLTSLTLGVSVCRFLKLDSSVQDRNHFWIGFSFLVALVQIWNFFLPVNYLTLIVALSVGIILSGKSLFRILKASLHSILRYRWVLVCSLMFAAWVANRCIGPNLYGDAAIYHVSQIEWMKQFPVITGLANLDFLLATNTSCLLVAAMIDVGPYHLHSMMIVNGLLLIVMMVRCLHAAAEIWEGNASLVDYTYLVLPCILIEFTGTSYLASTDFSAGAYVLQAFPILLLILSENSHDRYHLLVSKYAIAILYLTTAICLKQSTIFIGGLALLLICMHLFVRRCADLRQNLRVLSVSFSVSLVLLVPWLLRSIVLCGYPLFPFAHFGLPVEWKIPADVVNYYNKEFIYITQYSLVSIPSDVSSWQWHQEYLLRTLLKGRAMVVVPVAATLVFLLIAVFRRRIERRIVRAVILIMATLIIAIGIWLELVSQLRYGFFLFWGMANLSCAIFMLTLTTDKQRRIWAVIIVSGSSLFAVSVHAQRYFKTMHQEFDVHGIPLDRPLHGPGEYFGFHMAKIKPEQPELRVTASGLQLNVYNRGVHLWDGKLPATHMFNKNLRLVDPMDIRSGFRVVPDRDGSLFQGWWGMDRDYYLEPLPGNKQGK